MINSLVPVVKLQNGKPMANSRDVAAMFDKQHKHVLFAIRDIASQLTAENSAVWFTPSKVDQKAGFGVRNLVAGNGRGMAQATLISEAGLYKLIAKSDKPAAKAFDRWVRHEVLPAIRKTGG